MTNEQTLNANGNVMTLDNLLEHWQGHRRLTRRMIESFPEDKLFTYSVGGMRPFSEMVMEFLGMAVPGMKGIATGSWQLTQDLPHHRLNEKPGTKQELLDRWDEAPGNYNRSESYRPLLNWHRLRSVFPTAAK